MTAGPAASSGDTSAEMIAKVQALIAKAEQSPYPAEADAFMAKAQSLIQLHAIDEARLRGHDPRTIGDERLPMSGSYTRERSLIWGAVARANRCQVLTYSKPNSSAVIELCLIGRARDREVVKVLAASLELQGVRRLQNLDLDRSWEAPVVQRRSFLRGFADEVARRLTEANNQTPVYGATAAALELATDAVNDYVTDNFDISNRRSQARVDLGSFSRGRQAGASVDVGAGRLGRRRGALGPVPSPGATNAGRSSTKRP